MELPTVEIVNEAAKSGFTRINETDFDPKVHTLYKPQANSKTGGNGPGGVSGAGNGEKPPVAIPDDWAAMHHTKKINLAEQIAGKDIEATADQTKTQVAEGIIAAEVEKQKVGAPA